MCSDQWGCVLTSGSVFRPVGVCSVQWGCVLSSGGVFCPVGVCSVQWGCVLSSGGVFCPVGCVFCPVGVCSVQWGVCSVQWGCALTSGCVFCPVGVCSDQWGCVLSSGVCVQCSSHLADAFAVTSPHYAQLSVREAFHDAIELAHQYTLMSVNDQPGPSNRRPFNLSVVRDFGSHPCTS